MLPDRRPAEAEARDENEARQKAVEAGHPIDIVLRQEEDVLDTWFISGLWHLQLGLATFRLGTFLSRYMS